LRIAGAVLHLLGNHSACTRSTPLFSPHHHSQCVLRVPGCPLQETWVRRRPLVCCRKQRVRDSGVHPL
ncbi:unnamed protein product, partial [Laminaria digitata]